MDKDRIRGAVNQARGSCNSKLSLAYSAVAASLRPPLLRDKSPDLVPAIGTTELQPSSDPRATSVSAGSPIIYSREFASVLKGGIACAKTPRQYGVEAWPYSLGQFAP